MCDLNSVSLTCNELSAESCACDFGVQSSKCSGKVVIFNVYTYHGLYNHTITHNGTSGKEPLVKDTLGTAISPTVVALLGGQN